MVELEKIIEDTHLGDGVYASFDGFHVWLDLRAQDPSIRIALEPPVLRALDHYRDALRQRIESRQSHELNGGLGGEETETETEAL